MTEKYDLAIIGAGVAGVFAAARLNENSSLQTIVFDLGRPPGKRRRQIEGWLGCFPAGDGKVYTNIDKISSVVDGRKIRYINQWVLSLMKEANSSKLIKDSMPNAATQKKIAEKNFNIQTNEYYQWKPEQIHELSRQISDSIENSKNIDFSFDNEINKIYNKKGTFYISSANGEFQAKKIIICVGRSGWRWVNSLYKNLGLSIDDDYAKIGIRAELSVHHMKDFNKSHCSLHKQNLDVGPFAWNGSVIPEDHADLVLSNFRSNEDRWKSDKVSFPIVSSQYFKNSGCNQTDRIAKLTFLLFNDRIAKERIKLFIKHDSQLCHLREYDWLVETLEQLESFIPNIINKGYLYVPSIHTTINGLNLKSDLETDIDGLYVAGESAGFKGIMSAAVTGAIAADSVLK